MQSKSPFYWGTATAAFQIEGSPLADGAVASDWYKLTHLPEKILKGDHADVACDHYRRWREDIALMRQLEVNAYRFSVAWPRIFSDAHKLNRAGLDFYDRLVDGLCEAGIEPFVTLFHWDTPCWVDDQGGWLWKETPQHFEEYAQAVFERLEDRVSHWVTFNEPLVYYHSYITGWHWPFREKAYTELLTCWDAMLEAHFRVARLHASRGAGGKLGLVHSYHVLDPASESEADRAAAMRADGLRNRWFLDRLFTGSYPADMLELMDAHLPDSCREPSVQHQVPDFLGVNYYAIGSIRNDPSVELFGFSEPVDEFELQPIIPSHPSGLFRMVERVVDLYQPKELYLTENGYLEHEGAEPDPLDDVKRQRFLGDHFREVERCVEAGLPLRGYFHWSLLDNFEWRWGMNRRFGLVHVDRADQTRRMKGSGWLYRDLIRGFRERHH